MTPTDPSDDLYTIDGAQQGASAGGGRDRGAGVVDVGACSIRRAAITRSPAWASSRSSARRSFQEIDRDFPRGVRRQGRRQRHARRHPCAEARALPLVALWSARCGPVSSLCALALLTARRTIATPSPPKLRLPAGVRPTHYALDLRIMPSQPTFRARRRSTCASTRRRRWCGSTRPSSRSTAPRCGRRRDATGARRRRRRRLRRLRHGAADRQGRGAARRALARQARRREEPRALRVAEGKGADDCTRTRSSSRSTRAARSRASTSPAYKVPWKLTFHVKKEHVALGNAPVARRPTSRTA